MSNTVKIMIVAVVIIAVAVFGYWYTTSGGSQQGTTSALQSSNLGATSANPSLTPDDAALNDKFLALLLNMKTIKFDQSIFANPAYTSLKDFSTSIAPDTNPGRVNPFAPLGVDTQTISLLVTTNQPSAITKTTATFSGTLSAGAAPSALYFEYGTTSATPLPNVTTKVTGDPATGAFSFAITGLLPSTTYYVRAAAQVNGSVIYGSVLSFVTTSH